MTINQRNYLLLALLILIWGSSFLLINRSLLFFSPEQVVGYRLLIGSFVMIFIAFLNGKSLPGSLLPWLHFIIFAIIGNILPFLLIAKGQLSISSGMAGLLMAIMPLVTLILAHFFIPNDKLNRYKIIGFVLGISGVIFILGPSLNDNNNTVFGSRLIFNKNGIWKTNWATPPIRTPHARAIIGVARYCERKIALSINEMLRSTGVKAGTLKLSYVLRIEPDRAVREIKSR